MTFSYNLHDAGWACPTIEIDKKTIRMTTSYLHDSLLELTDAVVRLADRTTNMTSVIFMDEPGEHLMQLRLDEDGNLQMQIRWYDDWASWGMCPEDKFDIVFEAECSFLKFAIKVKNELTRIYTAYGLAGYKKKWVEHDFPLEKYQRLVELIRKLKQHENNQ